MNPRAKRPGEDAERPLGVARGSGRSLVLRLGLAILLIVACTIIGLFGQERLQDPRGFHLLAVDEPLTSVPFARPRRLWLVVIDGLREDFARPFASVKVLEAHGHCAGTKAMMPSLSMPAYAMMSSGVEAERTGIRANGGASPIAAESVWEVARGAKLKVVGVSELPWWKQMFPNGWDEFQTPPRDDDFFARALRNLGDVNLVHPLYVDEAGHSHGAASPEYAAAAQRADHELGELLATIDWTTDTVILTADHGHSNRGGHGGVQPEVTHILTCLAGHGVTVSTGDPEPPAPTHRDLASLIAVLLDVRLPHQALPPATLDARLDLPADYRAARTAELADARAKQLAALEGVRPAARRVQWIRALIACAIAAAIFVYLRRKQLGTLPWLAAVAVGHIALFVHELGSFDGTTVNTKPAFIASSLTVGVVAAVIGTGLHYAIFRDAARTASDELLLAGAGLGADLVQLVTFGWPMGYPIPRAELMFAPFFLSPFIVAHTFVAIVWTAGVAIRDRRRGSVSTSPST